MECGSGYAGLMSVDLPAPRILQLFDEMGLVGLEGLDPALAQHGHGHQHEQHGDHARQHQCKEADHLRSHTARRDRPQTYR